MGLDELFVVGKLECNDILMRKIMREHGGLGQGYQKISKKLKPYEIQSWMWEALPVAIAEWDSSKGKASTCWRKVITRLLTQYNRENVFVGAVKVPREYAVNVSKCCLDYILPSEVDVNYILASTNDGDGILYTEGSYDALDSEEV